MLNYSHQVFLIVFLSISAPVSGALKLEQLNFFVLGDKGESCLDACSTRQAFCDTSALDQLQEKEITSAFQHLNVRCVMDDRPWYDFVEPCVVVDPFDDNFGRCLGWRWRANDKSGSTKWISKKNAKNVCQNRWPTVRRLCRCAKKFDVITANI